VITVIIFNLFSCKEEGKKVIFHKYEILCFVYDFHVLSCKDHLLHYPVQLAFIFINKSKLRALTLVSMACKEVA